MGENGGCWQSCQKCCFKWFKSVHTVHTQATVLQSCKSNSLTLNLFKRCETKQLRTNFIDDFRVMLQKKKWWMLWRKWMNLRNALSTGNILAKSQILGGVRASVPRSMIITQDWQAITESRGRYRVHNFCCDCYFNGQPLLEHLSCDVVTGSFEVQKTFGIRRLRARWNFCVQLRRKTALPGNETVMGVNFNMFLTFWAEMRRLRCFCVCVTGFEKLCTWYRPWDSVIVCRPCVIICRIKTGSGGVCCHNARGRVRNRKSNPDGVAGGIWRTVCTSPSALWQQTPTDRS